MFIDEFTTLLNQNIQQILESSILSKFNFEVERIEDELEEGVEVEHSFTDKKNGIEITCDNNFLIKVIFLHSGKKTGESSEQYSYKLGKNISFDSKKKDVRKNLGEPNVFRDAFKSQFFGDSSGWDRYDFEFWSIHFQYSIEDEKIQLITFMSPDQLP